MAYRNPLLVAWSGHPAVARGESLTTLDANRLLQARGELARSLDAFPNEARSERVDSTGRITAGPPCWKGPSAKCLWLRLV